MKILFQYTDTPERELKLQNKQLLRQECNGFSKNCLVDKQQVHKQKEWIYSELPKHYNEQVEIALFCTWHFIGWMWKSRNLFVSVLPSWLALIVWVALVSGNAL